MMKLNYQLVSFLFFLFLNCNINANTLSIENKILDLSNFGNEDNQVTITNVTCDFGTISFDLFVTTNSNDNLFYFANENNFTVDGVPMTSTTLYPLEFGQTHSLFQLNQDFADATVILLNEAEGPLCDEPITISCPNDAPCTVDISVNNGDLEIDGLATFNNAKLFDSDFNIVWECADWVNTPCTDDVLLQDQPAGEYFLSLQSDFCNDYIPITITACEDNDNDGVCAFEDCDDNDPNLPPGSIIACDDNNPLTVYDVIQAQGCTCAGIDTNGCNITVEVLEIACNPPSVQYTIIATGTNVGSSGFGTFITTDQYGNNFYTTYPYGVPVQISQYIGNSTGPFTFGIFDPIVGTSCSAQYQVSCGAVESCNVTYSTENDEINIVGLTSNENVKLFDSNIDAVWECNPWNAPCSGNELITGLDAGNYFLSVQSDQCDEWIPIMVEGSEETCAINGNITNCLQNNLGRITYTINASNSNNPNGTFIINTFSFIDGFQERELTYGEDHFIGEQFTSFKTIVDADDPNCSIQIPFECGSVLTEVTISNCPDDIMVTIPPGESEQLVTWQQIYCNSTCAGDAAMCFVNQISGPSNGDFLPIGSYEVVYEATDGCGSNTATCSFIIDVTGDASCNLNVTTGNGTINISGLTSAENSKLFDTDFNSVWECNPWNGSPCSGTEVISGLANGQYFLSVQSDVCDEWIPITVETSNNFTIECPDDVVVLIPAGANTVNVTWDYPNCVFPAGCPPNSQICTVNQTSGPEFGDLVAVGEYTVSYDSQAGCGGSDNCSFNLSVQEGGDPCPINAFANVGAIQMTGLTSDANVKIFDEDYNVVWECNPWNGTPCNFQEAWGGAGYLNTYFVSVVTSQCEEWIPITIDGNNNLIETEANSKSTNSVKIQKVFPNPADQEAFVTIESKIEGAVEMEIYNLVGALQHQSTVNIEEGINSFELNVRDLKAGIYHLFVRDQKGQTTSTRFVKIND